MKCPKCSRRLRLEATTCLCGWSVSGEHVVGIDLAAILERYQQLSQERWEAAGRPPAEDSIAKMKSIANSPKPTPRQHWERVLRTRGLDPATYETARQCLQRLGWKERQPGEDDEEMAA